MCTKEQNRMAFGYKRNAYGQLIEYPEQAMVVKLIFGLYLNGSSLADIAKALKEKFHYPSPINKPDWSRQTIINILSSEKYKGNSEYPAIIDSDLFQKANDQKARRSNLDGATQRKGSRYSSGNTLSGLIVCGECGRNYRRIKKHDGQVVWRCANRVEHGKEVCHASPTISDEVIKQTIVKCLNEQGYHAVSYADYLVPDYIEKIAIQTDGAFVFMLQ